jgi:uncharacterized protein (DUF1330 family)
MKTLAILLAGTALGSFATFVAQGYAQQSKPGVIVIGETDVADTDAYAHQYAPQAVVITKRHGAQLLATGGAATAPSAGGNRITPLDDESSAALPPTRRMIVNAFPDLEHVKAWRNDPDYQKLRQEALASGWVKMFRAYAVDAVSSTTN